MSYVEHYHLVFENVAVFCGLTCIHAINQLTRPKFQSNCKNSRKCQEKREQHINKKEKNSDGQVSHFCCARLLVFCLHVVYFVFFACPGPGPSTMQHCRSVCHRPWSQAVLLTALTKSIGNDNNSTLPRCEMASDGIGPVPLNIQIQRDTHVARTRWNKSDTKAANLKPNHRRS